MSARSLLAGRSGKNTPAVDLRRYAFNQDGACPEKTNGGNCCHTLRVRKCTCHVERFTLKMQQNRVGWRELNVCRWRVQESAAEIT